MGFCITIRLLSIGEYVFGLYEQLCRGAILDEQLRWEFEMQLVAAEPLSKHKTGQTLPLSKPLSCQYIDMFHDMPTGACRG